MGNVAWWRMTYCVQRSISSYLAVQSTEYPAVLLQKPVLHRGCQSLLLAPILQGCRDNIPVARWTALSHLPWGSVPLPCTCALRLSGSLSLNSVQRIRMHSSPPHSPWMICELMQRAELWRGLITFWAGMQREETGEAGVGVQCY